MRKEKRFVNFANSDDSSIKIVDDFIQQNSVRLQQLKVSGNLILERIDGQKADK